MRERRCISRLTGIWQVFESADLFLEGRQIPFHHYPHFPQINPEIVMDQYMTHSDDLRPGKLRVSRTKYRSELAGSFPDYLNV